MNVWQRGSIAVAVTGLLVLATQLLADDSSDAVAIAEASRAFSAAYVAGDTATIRDLYTPDAVLLPPGREVRGRSAIVRFFAPIAGRQSVSHSMDSTELRIAGGVATDIGTWSYSWRRGNAEVETASDRYLVVWRRGTDGRWRIEFDMWHRPSD